MRNRPPAALLGLVALPLLLAACGDKGKAGPTTNPDDGGQTGTPDRPSAEARAAFDAVVADYQKAASKGKLSSADCERIATAFHNLYKQYPKELIAAEFNAAVVWDECGESKRAEDIYNTLKGQKYQLAFNNLGVMNWDRGRTKEAQDLFNQAIEADRIKAFAARNNLAAAHRERFAATRDMKDFEAAERQIQNVLAVDTSNKLAYENLARLYYDRGRLKDKSYTLLANLVVTQALRVLEQEGEQSADIWNLRGLLFMQRDDQVNALRAFKRAVAVDKDHRDANLNIAFISIRFRDFKGAEDALKRAYKYPSTERDIEAAIAMGVAKRGLKKFKEAEEWYNKAAKVDAKDPRPWFNLGVLYQDHMVGQDGVDVKKIEEFYNVAKKHYAKVRELSGGDKKWGELANEAKDRVIIIDDAIEGFRKQEEIERQVKELQKREAEQAEKERQRLLELEKQAEAAAGGG